MKKWMYLIFPGAMLGIFLVFFLSHQKESDAREKARAEAVAKKEAEDKAKKAEAERKAQEDAKKPRNAVEQAAAMAKTGGVAILNLLDAHHIGRIGHYAEAAAAQGLISLFWVNVAGRPPIVAPHGAREARFGTNPHAIGIPVPGAEPIILDFATSRM
eukprot:gene42524-57572_t